MSASIASSKLNGWNEALAYDSSLHISSEHASAIARSASCYGRSEDVLVHAVVIAELKFRDIERQILFADLMKRPHHTTLEDRPEAFDGIGMDRSNHILPLRVIDDLVWIVLAELSVSHPLIGYQQTDVICNGFPNKAGQRFGFDVRNDASHHIALALNRSSNDQLPRSRAARAAVTVAVVPILRLATNECLIDFDDPAELGSIARAQGDSDAMAHIPSRLVRTESHVATNLQGAHALLARQHQVRHFEPIPQRLIRVLEDRSTDMREAIGRSRCAVIALPMPRVALQFSWIVRTTAVALHAFGPTLAHEVGAARLLIRKRFLELWKRQLMQKFFGGHGRVSSVTGVCHV